MQAWLNNQLCCAEMKIMLLAIVVVTVSILLWHSSAQSVPAPGGSTTPAAAPTEIQEFLDAHNKARAEVGVGPLNWSSSMAKSASLTVRYQRDRQSCQFADLTSSKYGGNQMWSSGPTVTPRQCVENWVDEKKYYSYANNSCVPNHQCGTYTQVVWNKSLELGCAQAKCLKDQSVLTICFYNPPGNVVGESPY